MVVAAAGNVDHATVVRQVRTAFGRNDFLAGDESPVLPRAATRPRGAPGHARPPGARSSRSTWCSASTGMTRDDDRRFALGVLNTALGGGTSSRLFQEVRERRGLAYSVYSFASHHADAGLVGVSVGLPARQGRRGAGHGARPSSPRSPPTGSPTRSSTAARASCAGGLVLGLEDSGSRMSRLGKAELVYDELLSLDEVLARVDAVTCDEVNEIAAELFGQPEILAVVGPA